MLAVPSTWPETFGIVAAEAMGHGIPVVASRIGALQDTVVDGTSGILVEPGNAVDLANALRHLWDDPVSIRRLGEGAHLHVRENFSAQSHAERLAEHYQRAIDESASRH
jgi:glycosyltransferase involved in cell wall biosynthesis